MTVVQETLYKPGTAVPWTNAKVTVALVGPGFVTGGQVLGEQFDLSDDTGLVSFDLAPTVSMTPAGCYYVWTGPDNVAWSFTVPASGGPSTLQQSLISAPQNPGVISGVASVNGRSGAVNLDDDYVSQPAGGTAAGDVPTVQADGSITYAPQSGGVAGSAVDVGGFTELDLAGGTKQDLSKRFNEGRHDFQYLPQTGTARTARSAGAAPATLDSGHTFSQLVTNGLWVGTQSPDGFLDHDFSSAGSSAALYATVPPLPDKIRSIAADIMWESTVNAESFGLIAWKGLINPGTSIPLTNSHVIIQPDHWTWSFYEGTGVESVVAQGDFGLTPAVAGVLYPVRWVIDFELQCGYLLGAGRRYSHPIVDPGSAWRTSTTYSSQNVGLLRTANGNTYRLASAGTTAASGGGPTGTGTGIADGTATWDYVQAGVKSRLVDSFYAGTSPCWEPFSGAPGSGKVKVRKLWFDSGVSAKGRRETDSRHPTWLDLHEAIGRFRTGLAAENRTTTTRWAASTAYNAGDVVSANGNLFLCTTAGTSASTGFGPSGSGATIADGTVVWAYQAGASHAAWAASTAYTVGQYVVNAGNVYRVVTAGTSASSGGPTSGAVGGVTTDGTAKWICVATTGMAAGLTSAAVVVQRKSFTVPASQRLRVRTQLWIEYAATLAWRASTAYVLGNCVTINGVVYEAQNSATTGTTGPVGTTYGATETDGTVTWVCLGKRPTLFMQHGISGNVSFGPGTANVLGPASQSGLVTFEQVLDLSAFQVGSQWDATLHAFVGASTGPLAAMIDATGAVAKISTMSVERVDPLT